MDILEGLVICDSNMKKQIIEESKNEFKNYIFLSLSQLEDKLYGACDKKAIFALMDKYDLSYELALEYLHYIPYVNSEVYNNLKLDSLVSAKNHLIENNLYNVDKLFYYRLKQFPITFIDIEDTIRVKKIKDIISKYTKVYSISTCKNTYNPIVYKFKTIYDEAIFVCNKIIDLIKIGVSLNNIYLCNVDSDYSFLFERLAKHYNLAINLSSNRNINSLAIAKKFIELCDSCSSFSDILSQLDSNSNYYNSIFNIIVDYDLEDENPKDYKQFFIEKFKNISYKSTKYEQMISCSEKDAYNDNDYVFYLGFNLGVSPRVYKDDEYLNDDELGVLSLPSSTLKNYDSKAKLKKLLLSTKNIIITYKNSNGSDECFPSNMIAQLGLKVEDGSISYGYSKTEDDIRLGMLYTQYLKYKVLDSNVVKYDLNHLEYQEYDNKFTGIDSAFIADKFKEKPLKMAYSNLKTYFACPFSYYADRILGLNEFKPNMAARLGTFSHAVLEDSYNDDFNFDDSALKNTMAIALDSKDKFYFSIMEEVLRSLLVFNKEHEELSMLKNIEREAHIVYEDSGFIFEGYIDKLLYTEIQGEIYAAIIDYKTGKDIISLDNVVDGFHLQLPAYMFLLSKYEKFKGKKIHILGIYLQKVNIIALDNTMDIVAQREKHFKLQGFTVKSHSLISMLDPNYDKSTYIASLSTLKSGDFSRYAKLITEDEQQELINIVDDLIHKANDEIKAGRFDIEPKLINQKNESCMFCKYKDLCYMKYEDLKELEYKPFPKEKDGDE